MKHFILTLINIAVLSLTGTSIQAASVREPHANCIDSTGIRPDTNADADIYKPVLEVGKRWVYRNYYRGEPDIPYPVPYFELMVGEKIQENGKEMYAMYVRNAGETEFIRTGNRYEENGVVYAFDSETANTYGPMIDMTLPVGYVLPESYSSIFRKGLRGINGTERFVIELVGDYVGKSYYWIEGVGSFPDKFIYDFVSPISVGSEMVACYMDEECIFDAESFMAEMSSNIDIKPIIRNDRIWECVSDDGENQIVKYLKFDGSEMFDDKLFHRIVTCAKSMTKNNTDHENTELEFYEYLSEPEGYLREENGKVYTWLMGDYKDNCFYGSIYIPDSDYPNNYAYSEKLLYDFTCEPGDCLGSFSNVGDYGIFTGFDVISKSTVTVDGEECSLLEIRPRGEGENASSYKIAEGIGPVDFGCLNYNEYLDPQTNTVSHNHFNRLLDKNGHVLFRNPHGCIDFKLPEHLFSSVKTIDYSPRFEISDKIILFGESGNLNEVYVFDLNGKIVKSAISETRLTLTTDGLAPGVYIATATCNGMPAARCKIIIR